MLGWLAAISEVLGGTALFLAVTCSLFFLTGKLGEHIAGRSLEVTEKPAEAVSALDWDDYAPELDWDLIGRLELDLYGKRFYHSRDYEKKPLKEKSPYQVGHLAQIAMDANVRDQVRNAYLTAATEKISSYSESMGISREEYEHIIRHKENHGSPGKANRR
jgi:hypothetical protein